MDVIKVQDLKAPLAEMVSYWAQETLRKRKAELTYGNKPLGAFYVSQNGYMEYQAYDGKYEKGKYLYMPSLEDFFAVFLTGYYGYVFPRCLLMGSHNISLKIQENTLLQRRKLDRFYCMDFLRRNLYRRRNVLSLGEAGKALMLWKKDNPYLSKIGDTEKHVLLFLSSLFWEPKYGLAHRDPTEMRQYIKDWGKAYYEEHKHTENLAPILQMLSDLESIKEERLPRGIYVGMPATFFVIDKGEKKGKYEDVLSRLALFRERGKLVRKLIVVTPNARRKEFLDGYVTRFGEKHKIKTEVFAHTIAEDLLGFF